MNKDLPKTQSRRRDRLQRDIKKLAQRILRDLHLFDSVFLLNWMNDTSILAARSRDVHPIATDGIVHKFAYVRNLLLRSELHDRSQHKAPSPDILFKNVGRLFKLIEEDWMAQARWATEQNPERGASIEAWFFSRVRDLNEPPLGSGEQFQALFLDRFASFDTQLIEPALGVSCAECVLIIEHIGTVLTTRIDRLMNLEHEDNPLMKIHQQLEDPTFSMDEAISMGRSIYQSRYNLTATEVCAAMTDPAKTVPENLVADFLQATSAVPGTINGNYNLPTDEASIALFVDRGQGQYLMLDPPCVYRDIFLIAESKLSAASDNVRQKYFEWRGMITPQNVARTLARTFGTENISENLYYSPTDNPADLPEADIIVESEKDIILCEVKGHEANRSVSKRVGYERMKKEFETLQKGYDQCQRTHDYLNSKDTVVFSDNTGRKAIRSVALAQRNVHYLIVTSNSFGSLAGNCTGMLQMRDGGLMPVILSEFELTTIMSTISTPADFLRYLSQRAALHGRLRTHDELEPAGAYVTHGMSLQKFLDEVKDGEMLVLDGAYSFVFDETDQGEAKRLPHGDADPVLTRVTSSQD